MDLIAWIVENCEANRRYVTRRRNAASLIRLSVYQKILMTMWAVIYDNAAYYIDEYLPIGEDNTLEGVRKFAETVTKVLGVVIKY
jgi:hypothetical protein